MFSPFSLQNKKTETTELLLQDSATNQSIGSRTLPLFCLDICSSQILKLVTSGLPHNCSLAQQQALHHSYTIVLDLHLARPSSGTRAAAPPPRSTLVPASLSLLRLHHSVSSQPTQWRVPGALSLDLEFLHRSPPGDFILPMPLDIQVYPGSNLSL